MKIILFNIILTLLLILMFDVVAFVFLPNEYTYGFSDYRKDPVPVIGGRAVYQKNYFVNHLETGFDIGKNKTGQHWVDGISYPIWSNSLGCFDSEHHVFDKYAYFAGDSFTWGYAPFEDKFGTKVEEKTGTQIVKCGVTHTGQRHQFQKFMQVIDQIGKSPTSIFVFFYMNDVANDFVHPHSVVVDGWLVDKISINNNNKVVVRSESEIREGIKARLRKRREVVDLTESSLENRLKQFVKKYSLSANILISAGTSLKRRMNTSRPKADATRNQSLYDSVLLSDEKFQYSDNPKAQANKAAILDFNRFAFANSIAFVVVLIPPKEKVQDTRWYEEVREFLINNSIKFTDLTIHFRERDLKARDLYWKKNSHFNIRGNHVVADILIEEFPLLFNRGFATTIESNR